ncbi:MAG: SDR family NAD(P)-dependent oxidoreductase [Bacteroidetes bacterium]|nr:MAG: SDR family NAD(P)-dependent oxidoreductase [Bacteroidota bacterium]
MEKHSGKIAVICGATGEVGRAVTARLSEDGAYIIAVHSGRRSTSDSVHSIDGVDPGRVEFVAFDSTMAAETDRFWRTVEERYGRADTLVHLTGGISKSVLTALTIDEWHRMLSLNLDSAFLMMRGAMRLMQRQRTGRIITIAARTALEPESGKGAYAASKAGLIALSRTAAEEVRDWGDVTVNVLAPGTIRTPSNLEWGSPVEAAAWTTTEEIASTVSFLCSQDASGINGTIVTTFGKGRI